MTPRAVPVGEGGHGRSSNRPPRDAPGARSVELSIEVERSPEEVFALLANLENDPRWRREWVDARPASPGSPAVGSTTVLVGHTLGRRFQVEYEVTALVPNRTVTWRTLSGPLPLLFSRSVEPVARGARVTFVYQVTDPGLLLRTFGPMIRRIGRRQLEGDIPRLLKLLGGPSPEVDDERSRGLAV